MNKIQWNDYSLIDSDPYKKKVTYVSMTKVDLTKFATKFERLLKRMAKK